MNDKKFVSAVVAVLSFHVVETQLARRSNRPYSVINVLTPTVSALAIAGYIFEEKKQDSSTIITYRNG